MASSREYLDFVLEQLTDLDGIACRPMMGEYVLYYQGKVVGGLYDNRLLVKPTASVRALMPDAPDETPYPGARPLLMVQNIDSRDFLSDLFHALDQDLPAPKQKQK